ncbi:MAG: aldo/keto reductase [Proteobacteria bacterium]|nr:aldo/keto reductase [Pseudomonadota bacterium]
MKLGKTNLSVSTQGLGCMSMSEFYGKPMTESAGVALIKKAYQEGINFFDTADMYACGKNEALLGRAVSELLGNDPSIRSELVIATKCGVIRDENDPMKRGFDNSREYVLECCDKSLKHLGSAVGFIDLYYIHRFSNQGAQIDEAMKAMSELLLQGKIKSVGLSEAKVNIIQEANQALLKYTNGVHQLAAVQSEYSLMTRNVEKNGVLDICRELGITFVAYSPLSRALLTDQINLLGKFEAEDFRQYLPRFSLKNLEHNKKIVEKIRKLADIKHCTVSQIALAWVMHQAGVVPLPGTTKEKNLLLNIEAEKLKLTKEDLDYLDTLETPLGYRYTEEAMRAYGFEDEL